MAAPLRVLLLEDRLADAELIVHELRRAGFDPVWERVESEAEFLARLDPALDVILADYTLPQFDTERALQCLQARALDIPFIIVSGTIGEERAVGALRSGATDYLLKDRLARLGPAVTQALEQRRVRAEKRHAEEALRATRDALQTLVEASPLAIVAMDPRGRVTTWSRAAERIFGWSEEEARGRPLPTVPAERRGEVDAILSGGPQGPPSPPFETRWRRKDGGLVDVLVTAGPLTDARGQVTGAMVLVADLTERRELEAQLRQAQKLEAVGQLAGGIAHDFNNLLTVILGRATVCLGNLAPEHPQRRNVEMIKRTAERAAALTRQLLAFSRRQLLQPKVLDLNAVVGDVAPMLRRLIGEDIELVLAPADALWRVKADPGQIEQVIVNLAVNARDAMPRGGRLTIETANVELSPDFAYLAEAVPAGPYVMLKVADTGVGMDADTRTRIFEPFFTTKEAGRGTGLGLAMVHGIVRQHGGAIRVYSAPGQGAAFKIYLPRAQEAGGREAEPGAAPALLGGRETVLLVEDDAEVAALAGEILEHLGYAVLQAADGAEALRVAVERGGPIDLVVTDVVMPRLGGGELVQRLRALRPGLRALYLSGYTDRDGIQNSVGTPGTALLPKPFTPDGLARKVREVLDGPPAPGGAAPP